MRNEIGLKGEQEKKKQKNALITIENHSNEK